MLTRIVKMTFLPEQTPEFLNVFHTSAPHIRAFEGCLYLELLNVPAQPHIYFTYSRWKDEASLYAYRNSRLFQSTWAKTKILFAEKAEAWSLESVEQFN